MLDTQLIVRRRHELGLSQRHVARQLGVSPVTVAALESGTNHHDLPMRLVARLADTLACELVKLIAPEHQNGRDADDGLVAEVGALLASTDHAVAVETLAEALDSTLDRVRQQLKVLDQELRGSGLRLMEAPAGVQIVADPSGRAPEAFQQLLRGQHARHGLTATEAKLLHRALNGTLEPGDLTHAEQVAYARLLNARLIDLAGGLDNDVLRSLYTERRLDSASW